MAAEESVGTDEPTALGMRRVHDPLAIGCQLCADSFGFLAENYSVCGFFRQGFSDHPKRAFTCDTSFNGGHGIALEACKNISGTPSRRENNVRNQHGHGSTVPMVIESGRSGSQPA